MMQVAKPHFKVPSRAYYTRTVVPVMYARSREKTEKVLSLVQHCRLSPSSNSLAQLPEADQLRKQKEEEEKKRLEEARPTR